MFTSKAKSSDASAVVVVRANGRYSGAARNFLQDEGGFLATVHAPLATPRPTAPPRRAATTEPGAQTQDIFESREDLCAQTGWGGELFGGVAAETEPLVVLWLGLGRVCVAGTQPAIAGTHIATVKDALRRLSLMLQADITVSPDLLKQIRRDANSGALKRSIDRNSYGLAVYDDVLESAAKGKSSDIHVSINKYTNRAKLALRLHGRKRPWFEMSEELAKAFIGAGFGQRLIAGTNTAGSINWTTQIAFMTEQTVDGSTWNARCNGRASQMGFKMVMRLLESNPDVGTVPTLEELGYTASHLQMIRAALARNYGLIIIFGATGSGKSTTLRTCILKEQNLDSLEFISVESPVEYVMPGVTQISIPVASNMGGEEMSELFTAALRDAMRMDPDALFMQEVRDAQTMQLCAEFARAGHQAFSTSHADSAPDGIARLCGEELRMPSELLASPRFLRAAIYQRLLPKLCEHCRVPASAEQAPPHLKHLCLPQHKIDTLRTRYSLDARTMWVANPDGCAHCKPKVAGMKANGTRGVTVCAEVMVPDERMRALAAAREWAAMAHTWRQTRRAGFADADMTGKTAMECALYQASVGRVSIVDIEQEFEPIDQYAITELSQDLHVEAESL